MAARKALDSQPGSPPEIRATGEDVTFRFEVAGVPAQMKLAMRCDAKGGIWSAIVSDEVREERPERR
jgi:hypothetical protein